MSQNVIELNGKRYDAVTGAYLGKSHVVPRHITLQPRTTDGFVRPRPAPKPKPATAAHVPAAAPARPSAAPKQPDSAVPTKRVHGPKHLKAHRPQRAKTLMRRAVHKPEFTLKPAIKPQAPAEVMAKPPSGLMRKHSVASVDPTRLERAARVAKHQAIRHFHPAHRPVATHTVASHVPVISVRPAPLHAVRPARQNPKQPDVFEAAIARATSHEQPRPKLHRHRRHRRLVNSLAIVGTFLVIGSFIGYLNLPHLQLKVASIQAGFQASIPTYTPTGYALETGAVRHGGTVSLSFRSGSSRYTITQQASNWNSQTLLDNTLALSQPHQTIQRNGQTIYVYGNGANAAWVNGGVRYDIAGNAQLTPEDIADIATSL